MHPSSPISGTSRGWNGCQNARQSLAMLARLCFILVSVLCMLTARRCMEGMHDWEAICQSLDFISEITLSILNQIC
jgi:hypothetical protein